MDRPKGRDPATDTFPPKLLVQNLRIPTYNVKFPMDFPIHQTKFPMASYLYPSQPSHKINRPMSVRQSVSPSVRQSVSPFVVHFGLASIRSHMCDTRSSHL